jgi:hypothetical protein
VEQQVMLQRAIDHVFLERPAIRLFHS